MTLRIGRKFLVMLLAVAIVAPPAAVRFANAMPAASAAVAAGQAAPDHEHHHQGAPSGETRKAVNDGVCPAGCSPCFDFVATNAVSLDYTLSFETALKPARVATIPSSLMGSPPFRPPRS
jgi:hypothetical protein